MKILNRRKVIVVMHLVAIIIGLIFPGCTTKPKQPSRSLSGFRYMWLPIWEIYLTNDAAGEKRTIRLGCALSGTNVVAGFAQTGFETRISNSLPYNRYRLFLVNASICIANGNPYPTNIVILRDNVEPADSAKTNGNWFLKGVKYCKSCHGLQVDSSEWIVMEGDIDGKHDWEELPAVKWNEYWQFVDFHARITEDFVR